MPRSTSAVLTEREAQIMEILWDRGQATAEEVRAALPDAPHDSTVRTLLRVLKNKRHLRTRGRQPVTYVPIVQRSTAQHTAARRLIERFFGGSADALVLRLLEDEHLTPDQLEKLRKRFTSSQRRKGDPP